MKCSQYFPLPWQIEEHCIYLYYLKQIESVFIHLHSNTFHGHNLLPELFTCGNPWKNFNYRSKWVFWSSASLDLELRMWVNKHLGLTLLYKYLSNVHFLLHALQRYIFVIWFSFFITKVMVISFPPSSETCKQFKGALWKIIYSYGWT